MSKFLKLIFVSWNIWGIDLIFIEANIEPRTESFSEFTRVGCSNSVNHDHLQVL